MSVPFESAYLSIKFVVKHLYIIFIILFAVLF